ncbi:tetratricopeptide repeat protein [Archangium violaceum]|uniref:tetratricopeptide repeat protein n=1 Tax=Archangium violaceum TaxID=83451 RepID=UPI00193B92D0|nr:tetratricopeptide repeat protein [Archangium violaceum]QRK04827.1 tetratricopeptide repeat protein [Archangium violaceum]
MPPPSSVTVSPPGSPSSRQRRLHLALVCVCAALAYANTLGNRFAWVDLLLIESNPWIRDFQHLGDIFGSDLWAFIPSAGLSRNYYRPLVHVTFLLCHAIFGLQPWGYHLLLLVGHAAVSALVYLVGLIFCARRQSGPLAALAAGLLFAVHPIHTESVAWISSVNDVAMTLGALAAAWWMMTSGPGLTGRCLLAGLALFFALLFKEPAVLLPAMVFVYDFVVGSRAWSLRQWMGRYAPLLVALVLYAALRLPALSGAPRTLHYMSLGTWGLILNILPLLAQYLGGLVLPLELNAVHVFKPITSPADPQLIAGVGALAGLVVAALLLWRRAPTAFVALVWCLLAVVPQLYIPVLGVNAFSERYLYLPSVGFLLLVGWVLEELERWRPTARPWLLGGLAMVVVAGGVATALRNRVWYDNLTLWSDTVSKSPEEPSVQAGMGSALLKRGMPTEAIAHLELARKSNPEVLSDLAVAYAQTGRLLEAESVLREVIRFEPENAGGWLNLCLVRKNLKQLPSALEACETAARLEPRLPEVRTSFGQLLWLQGRVSEAEQQLREALALNPDFAPARRLLERIVRDRTP